MIGRRVFEHRTRPSVGAILWVALTTGLVGCVAPAPGGENPLLALDWTRKPTSNSSGEREQTPAPVPGPLEAKVAETAHVTAAAAVPAQVPQPVPEATLPVIKLAALEPVDPAVQPAATIVRVTPLTHTGTSVDVPSAVSEATLPVVKLAAPEPLDPAVQQAAATVQPVGDGPLPPPPSAAPASLSAAPLVDENLLTAACTSCGQFHVAGSTSDFGGSCGPGGCVPGRMRSCSHPEHSTFIGRFASNLYHCLCCPDPCYEPKWVPEANASFFVDPARPRTQKRLRWDHAYSFWFPDRSEYFWARSFRGPGPQARIPVTKSGRPVYGERMLNYDQLYVYIEAALPRFGFFTEIPYRSTSPDLTAHHAGFADMNIGTKSLLLDCDLLQLTLQFKTYLPIGSVSDGLGNGHVSLEPSLLMAAHLAPHTYLQGQLAEWVPLGGDPDYAGAILHYHLSLNHLLWQVLPDVPLIGTLEFNGWSFQDGAYTAPILGPKNSSGDSYLSLGPGLRMSVCDFIDFGVGTAFALDSPNWGDPLIRSEIRIFY